MTYSSRSVAKFEIEDIEGIGPTNVRKMKEAGISSVMDLVTVVADDLATDLGGSKDTAATFIMAAQKLLRESGVLDNEFTTVEVELEKRKSLLRCIMGAKALDELLLGGRDSGYYRVLRRIWKRQVTDMPHPMRDCPAAPSRGRAWRRSDTHRH